jgi:hypothetical protein
MKSLMFCNTRAQLLPENERFIFIKAWNEWAEGNYLEPDSDNGLSMLSVVKKFKESLSDG